MSTVGSRLRKERERLGLIQTELAEKIGISRTSQQNYENDRRKPDTDYLSRVADLGVDVQYVITGERVRQDSKYAVSGQAGT